LGHRRDEGAFTGNLGSAYRDLGQVEKAIEYHQQALDIARKTGYRYGEGHRLWGLGLDYRDLGQTTQAKGYLEQALAVFEEIKSPHAEDVREDLEKLGD
jgi:tetratricopeptide (TPR) repeat protein